ncbi:MAG: hypothetical protein VXX60_05935, partial [Bacteroidota bacterium]|nr:hypothetical protein [Bacteroidota bacterium]
MSSYVEYLNEIEVRKNQNLDPKTIDGSELMTVLIDQIRDVNHQYREDSLNFLIYNVLPGTTPAAAVKANFLKEIIIGKTVVN